MNNIFIMPKLLNPFISYPREIFGLEFNPSESEPFRNLIPNHSESFRTNLKKFWNLVRWKLVKKQSDSIRFIPVQIEASIRIIPTSNSKLYLDQYEVGLTRIEVSE